MFHNYRITARRNFTRHKLYSFINTAGLTVVLASASGLSVRLIGSWASSMVFSRMR